MALSYPLDILGDWPGWTPKFKLMWRHEQSRQTNGVTRTKDFGEPLWTLKATSRDLSRRELDHWRARLDALGDGINTFKGYPLSRCWPVAYPRGAWPTGVAFNGLTATVHTIGGDNKSLRVDLLPAGYVVSVGDMLSITYSTSKHGLLRVMETVTADGSGVTPAFEVQPHLPIGVAIDDLVMVKRPYCLMTIVPGSVDDDSGDSGRGKISFEAVEYR